MSVSKTVPTILFAGCLSLLGCNDPAQPPAPPAPGPAQEEGGAVSGEVEKNSDVPVPAEQITLETANWEQVQAAVASYQGKVVVLDVWSTDCSPCLREFPKLVELYRKHKDAGVVCLTVAVDYIGLEDEPPEFYREGVMKVLEKNEATFQHFLMNTPSDEFFEQIKLASIPAVYVYGRDGKLANRFDNQKGLYGDEFTYQEHVTPFVEKLLNDPQ